MTIFLKLMTIFLINKICGQEVYFGTENQEPGVRSQEPRAKRKETIDNGQWTKD